MEFNIAEHSHRRYNALTGEWVLVSPHRSKRPWQGKVEKIETENRPPYDATCYLCPGNPRAGGKKNPAYADTFVFDNDFAALQPDIPGGVHNVNDLLLAKAEQGICRVICFSPKHNLTLPQLQVSEIEKVIDVWIDEFITLSSKQDINYVQIFENKGEMMGCSNPHPHGQIWAQKSIPVEVEKENIRQQEYFTLHNISLLSAYLDLETPGGERLILRNNSFIVLTPFWAVWPYETIVIPRRPMKDISVMTKEEKKDFADIIKRLTVRYDNLFNVSFPYSAGIHQAPADGNSNEHWHWHMHFYPPLLRSATIKKFMVGYEMLANPQRDITPEFSAERLRSLPAAHYLKL